MYQNLIIELLKAKFAGVSDSIINRIATKLAKTVTTEEQAKTAVEGVTFQQVLESYGDSRATEAQRTAVQNYEQKHGLKDGKPIENNDKGGGQGDGTGSGNAAASDNNTPEWAKAIIESNKALKERLDAMDGDRITSIRRQKISEITQKLPEHLRKAYDRTPVDKLTEEEFQSLTQEISTEVEAIVKDSNIKGAVFGMPSVGGKQQQNTLSEAQVKAISNRSGAPEEGQPF